MLLFPRRRSLQYHGNYRPDTSTETEIETIRQLSVRDTTIDDDDLGDILTSLDCMFHIKFLFL